VGLKVPENVGVGGPTPQKCNLPLAVRSVKERCGPNGYFSRALHINERHISQLREWNGIPTNQTKDATSTLADERCSSTREG
jgi:hypothetical protein